MVSDDQVVAIETYRPYEIRIYFYFRFSDTGAFVPASYVFGILLQFGALCNLASALFGFQIQRRQFSVFENAANRRSAFTNYRQQSAKYLNYCVPFVVVLSTLGAITVAHIEVCVFFSTKSMSSPSIKNIKLFHLLIF